jgi:hypothetical protein
MTSRNDQVGTLLGVGDKPGNSPLGAGNYRLNGNKLACEAGFPPPGRKFPRS